MRSSGLLVCSAVAGFSLAASADVLFLVSNTTNQVHVMNVPQVGAPTHVTNLSDPGFVRPYGVNMRGNGDLLVNSRGPCTACLGGGLTVMSGSGCGLSQGPGQTTTAGLRNPHGVAVLGDIAYFGDTYNGRIVRYSLAGGVPVQIGQTTAGVPVNGTRDVVIHPVLGEVFVSDCCNSNNIRRFRIEGDGSLSPIGTISGNGMNQPHGLTVLPSGELLVCNTVSPGSVSRFRFGPSGVAIANGIISGNAMNGPVSSVVTSWGELLVVSHMTPIVSRFVFDGGGAAAANGTFPTPTNGGDSVLAGTLPAFVPKASQSTACVGDEVSFHLVGVSGAAFTYQWRRDGTPIDIGANPTAATAVLTLTAGSSDEGEYDCVVDTGCGSAITPALPLTVCKCAECAADFNEDGGIDGSDVSAFFEAWERGDCDADVNGDGGVEGGDVSTFFGQWEAGGC